MTMVHHSDEAGSPDHLQRKLSKPQPWQESPT